MQLIQLLGVISNRQLTIYVGNLKTSNSIYVGLNIRLSSHWIIASIKPMSSNQIESGINHSKISTRDGEAIICKLNKIRTDIHSIYNVIH